MLCYILTFFSQQFTATRSYSVQRKQSLRPFRKSARLQEKQSLYRQLKSQEKVHHLSSPTSNTPDQKACSAISSLNSCMRLTESRSPRKIYRSWSGLQILIENENGPTNLVEIARKLEKVTIHSLETKANLVGKNSGFNPQAALRTR